MANRYLAVSSICVLSLVVASCSNQDDSRLPSGIEMPDMVAASMEPAPPYLDHGTRFQRLPEPFREPAAALQEIAGLDVPLGTIVFVDPEDLNASLGSPGDYDTLAAMRQAFGLSNATDPAAERAAIEDAVIAYVDIARVYWASPGGAEPIVLTNAERTIAVHEFAHFVTNYNHQRYANRLYSFASEGGALDLQVIAVIAEGTAEYFADEYLDAMPPEAQEGVRDEWDARRQDPGIDLTPTIESAEFELRYSLGQRFFEAAEVAFARRDPQSSLIPGEIVTRVLTDEPLLTVRSFLDPWAYLDGDDRTVFGTLVEDSVFLEDLESVRQARLNAAHWYFSLAPVLGMDDALTVSREIVSISSIGESAPTPAGARCFSVNVTASSEGRELALEAMEAWRDADAGNRMVLEVDEMLEVTGCVPDASDPPLDLGNPLHAMHYVAMVVDGETEAVRQNVDRAAGRCAAQEFRDAQEGFPDIEGRRLYGDVLDQLVARCS